VKLPLDLDHSVQKKNPSGDAATIAGWIVELQAGVDGLFGRVDWLATGLAALTAKTHPYVSPTFFHTDDGTATWMHSVALVPAPALGMPAIASAGSFEDLSIMKKIAVALGLADTADETACLSAITTLSAGKVDKAIHDQALANLATITAANETAQAKLAALAAEGRKVKGRARSTNNRMAFQDGKWTMDGIEPHVAIKLKTMFTAVPKTSVPSSIRLDR